MYVSDVGERGDVATLTLVVLGCSTCVPVGKPVRMRMRSLCHVAPGCSRDAGVMTPQQAICSTGK